MLRIRYIEDNLRLLSLGVFLFVLTVGAGIRPDGGGATSGDGRALFRSCQPVTASRYDAVFRSMPDVNRPPQSGHLPFGPGNLAFYRTSGANVVSPKGVFGYSLARVGSSGAFSPGWLAITRVLRVNRRGIAIGVEGVRRSRVVVGGGADRLTFAVPVGQRGLYRYDLKLRTLAGKRLGSYSEYFRVMPARFRASLALVRGGFDIGDTAMVKVVNSGTVGVGYGLPFNVEKYEAGAWFRVRDVIEQDARSRGPLMRLAPGTAGGCQALKVSQGTPPGRYRLSQLIYPLDAQGKKRVHLSFDVK